MYFSHPCVVFVVVVFVVAVFVMVVFVVVVFIVVVCCFCCHFCRRRCRCRHRSCLCCRCLPYHCLYCHLTPHKAEKKLFRFWVEAPEASSARSGSRRGRCLLCPSREKLVCHQAFIQHVQVSSYSMPSLSLELLHALSVA